MRLFYKALSIYRKDGVRGLIFRAWRRLLHPPPRAKCYRLCKKHLSRAAGLEIGGPSGVFSRGSILPLYPLIRALDNCNFADKTTWETTIEEGMTFRFDESRPLGRQYISDATDLLAIPSSHYDVVLSSHVIEHIANPLRALCEWVRVLKENGLLVLIIPHKDGTFDHLRPVTTFEHILQDFKFGMGEDDLTHLPEILKLHDLRQSLEVERFEEFRNRSERNFENRCLHHHVFNTELVARILDHLNLEILALEQFLVLHIVVIARKYPPSRRRDNRCFIGKRARYRYQTPFSSDRY